MNSALQGVIQNGTGRAALVLNRNDIAGKTGTTNEENDTWFSGFNGDVVATTWVGFDQPDSLHEHGAQAALPMWIEFMKEALAGKPPHTMTEPADISSVRIDPATGLLAGMFQTNSFYEYFRKGTEPKEDASSAPATGQAPAGLPVETLPAVDGEDAAAADTAGAGDTSNTEKPEANNAKPDATPDANANIGNSADGTTAASNNSDEPLF